MAESTTSPNESVQRIEQRLKALGFDVGTEDGIRDEALDQAVKSALKTLKLLPGMNEIGDEYTAETGQIVQAALKNINTQYGAMLNPDMVKMAGGALLPEQLVNNAEGAIDLVKNGDQFIADMNAVYAAPVPTLSTDAQAAMKDLKTALNELTNADIAVDENWTAEIQAKLELYLKEAGLSEDGTYGAGTKTALSNESTRLASGADSLSDFKEALSVLDAENVFDAAYDVTLSAEASAALTTAQTFLNASIEGSDPLTTDGQWNELTADTLTKYMKDVLDQEDGKYSNDVDVTLQTKIDEMNAAKASIDQLAMSLETLDQEGVLTQAPQAPTAPRRPSQDTAVDTMINLPPAIMGPLTDILKDLGPIGDIIAMVMQMMGVDMSDYLGEQGRDISTTEKLQAELKNVYKDALQESDGDPAKLRAQVLNGIDVISVFRSETDKAALRKAAIDALDAAAAEPDPEKAAEIFAAQTADIAKNFTPSLHGDTIGITAGDGVEFEFRIDESVRQFDAENGTNLALSYAAAPSGATGFKSAMVFRDNDGIPHIAVMDKESNSFHVFNVNERETQQEMMSILTDRENYLWAAGPNGMAGSIDAYIAGELEKFDAGISPIQLAPQNLEDLQGNYAQMTEEEFQALTGGTDPRDAFLMAQQNNQPIAHYTHGEHKFYIAYVEGADGQTGFQIYSDTKMGNDPQAALLDKIARGELSEAHRQATSGSPQPGSPAPSQTQTAPSGSRATVGSVAATTAAAASVASKVALDIAPRPEGRWSAMRASLKSDAIMPYDAELEETQTYLKSLGLYNGAIDGLEGPGTRAGMQQYADAHNINILTTTLEELNDHMQQNAGVTVTASYQNASASQQLTAQQIMQMRSPIGSQALDASTPHIAGDGGSIAQELMNLYEYNFNAINNQNAGFLKPGDPIIIHHKGGSYMVTYENDAFAFRDVKGLDVVGVPQVRSTQSSFEVAATGQTSVTHPQVQYDERQQIGLPRTNDPYTVTTITGRTGRIDPSRVNPQEVNEIIGSRASLTEQMHQNVGNPAVMNQLKEVNDFVTNAYINHIRHEGAAPATFTYGNQKYLATLQADQVRVYNVTDLNHIPDVIYERDLNQDPNRFNTPGSLFSQNQRPAMTTYPVVSNNDLRAQGIDLDMRYREGVRQGWIAQGEPLVSGLSPYEIQAFRGNIVVSSQNPDGSIVHRAMSERDLGVATGLPAADRLRVFWGPGAIDYNEVRSRYELMRMEGNRARGHGGHMEGQHHSQDTAMRQHYINAFASMDGVSPGQVRAFSTLPVDQMQERILGRQGAEHYVNSSQLYQFISLNPATGLLRDWANDAGLPLGIGQSLPGLVADLANGIFLGRNPSPHHPDNSLLGSDVAVRTALGHIRQDVNGDIRNTTAGEPFLDSLGQFLQNLVSRSTTIGPGMVFDR